MDNPIKRKINIFGKIGKIVVTVFIVLLFVAEGAMITGSVIIAAVPKDAVTLDVSGKAKATVNAAYFGLDNGEVSVKLGDSDLKLADVGKLDVRADKDGKINIDAASGDMRFDLWDALKLLLMGIVKVATLIVGLYFFRALTKQLMVCDTPFCDGVIRKMRNFSIALIALTGASMAADSVFGVILTGAFSFGGINLVSVGFVLVVLVLTMIFKYGAQLQQQYDETV